MALRKVLSVHVKIHDVSRHLPIHGEREYEKRGTFAFLARKNVSKIKPGFSIRGGICFRLITLYLSVQFIIVFHVLELDRCWVVAGRWVPVTVDVVAILKVVIKPATEINSDIKLLLTAIFSTRQKASFDVARSTGHSGCSTVEHAPFMLRPIKQNSLHISMLHVLRTDTIKSEYYYR